MSGTHEPESQADDRILDTYRYVRIITPLPAVWLLCAISAVALLDHELLPSISDYYAGPLRDVFVGALMASGVGMIAYKGDSKLEDYALNFAGINAFFVALVSNSFQSVLDATRATETAKAPVLISSAQLLQNLRIGVFTFLLVILVFVASDLLLMHWTRFRLGDQTPPTNVLIGLSFFGEFLLVVVVLLMLDGVEKIGSLSIFSTLHFTAASLLIINLSFAAASHAFPAKLRKDRVDAQGGSPQVQRGFRFITGFMWAGLVAGAIMIPLHVPDAMILVESYEILWFLAFWFTATRSEWRQEVRTGSASHS